MAISKAANTYNRLNWEEAEFPVLCQTCLGDNPYVRMIKEKYGKECHICRRPFTVFRWCPGARMRYKTTVVCQTCSRLKNVCQTCLLDLEYGLPVEVRDKALKLCDEFPKSDVNREYWIQNKEREMALQDPSSLPLGAPPGSGGPGGSGGGSGGGGKIIPSDMLMKLRRTTPYYKRNRPHICSFWVKGECKRGEECPYRHEKPTDPDDPLANQNIKDRFHGAHDPVAAKLMKRYNEMPHLDPPEDKSVSTLYLGGLGDIKEEDIRAHFYQYGEIRSVHMSKKSDCAFVQFTTRASAEVAAERSFNKLIIKGKRIMVNWSKPQSSIPIAGAEDAKPLAEVPGLQGSLDAPPLEALVGRASGPGDGKEPAGPGSDFFGLTASIPDGMAGPARPGMHPNWIPPPLSRPPPMVRPHLGSSLPPGAQPVPMPNMFPLVNFHTGAAGQANTAPVPGQIHYPSQDPSRLGATTGHTSKDKDD